MNSSKSLLLLSLFFCTSVELLNSGLTQANELAPNSVDAATQNQIQYKRNNVGVAVQFGNGTSFGVQGKVGVAENISIRPEVFFNSGSNAENRLTTLSDINLPNFTTINTNGPFTTIAPFTLPTAIILNTPVTSPVSFVNKFLANSSWGN